MGRARPGNVRSSLGRACRRRPVDATTTATACRTSQHREPPATSAWRPTRRAPVRDPRTAVRRTLGSTSRRRHQRAAKSLRPRRSPPRCGGQRHDRDHRVGARGGREGARVADPDARRVVQLAPRVRRRRSPGRCPSGRCPSGGRRRPRARAARASTRSTRARNASKSSPRLQASALAAQRHDLARARRLVHPGHLLQPAAEVGDVELVGERGSSATALPAASTSTRPWPRSRIREISNERVAQPGISSLCWRPDCHGVAAAASPVEWCGALEQEAVARPRPPRTRARARPAAAPTTRPAAPRRSPISAPVGCRRR